MQTQDDEIFMFRELMADVTPLPPSGKIEKRVAMALTPGQQYRREAAQRPLDQDFNPLTTEFVEYVDPQATLSFRRDGIQHGVFRKLQQGQYAIEAAQDLHSLSVEQARRVVYRFIHNCMQHDVRLALINHGKGGREPGKPAYIKSYVARWLPLFPEVIAFHSAQPWHGGTGAVYVLLRKSQKQKELTRQKLGLISEKPE